MSFCLKLASVIRTDVYRGHVSSIVIVWPWLPRWLSSAPHRPCHLLRCYGSLTCNQGDEVDFNEGDAREGMREEKSAATDAMRAIMGDSV